ncbi:MAG: hypothetical protein LBL74_06890 [Bacteroidales bacterium]|nr:hypothetical protein [Bacteroidales bacterium]
MLTFPSSLRLATRHCGLDPQSPFFMVQKVLLGIAGQARNDVLQTNNNDQHTKVKYEENEV